MSSARLLRLLRQESLLYLDSEVVRVDPGLPGGRPFTHATHHAFEGLGVVLVSAD